MRSIGGRFQLSAREFATPGSLRAAATMAAERTHQDAFSIRQTLRAERAVVVERVAGELLRDASDRR